MSKRLHTVFTQLGQGPYQFAQDVNEVLGNLSPMTINDIDLRGVNRGSDSLVSLTFTYDEGGTNWGAMAAVGKDGNAESAAGAALAAFMGYYRNAKGRFLRSLNGFYSRSTATASLLVLFEIDTQGDDAYTAWPQWSAPRIGLALDAINPGGVGAVELRTRDMRIPATLQVRNESPIVWTAGTAGYLYRDAVDKQWHGFPSCC